VAPIKALWLLPIIAIGFASKHRRSTDSAFILICIAAAIALTTVGVDWSRMAGYGFPAILISLKLILASPRPGWTDRALTGLFVVNLLIPSYRVGLNAGIRTKRGLYRGILQLITSR
jgi:thiamine transporter ThiT